MDPFSKLPLRIALSIAKLSPDLDSLRRLICASPTMASLFNELGAEITDAVLSATLSPVLQPIFRFVVLVRSNTVPSLCDLKVFLDSYVYTYEASSESQLNVAPQILRELLAISGQIQRLACICMMEMHERFLTYQPSHLLDPHFKWDMTELKKDTPITFPTGRRYTPLDGGPFSWLEQQRVVRGFWCLQLFLDIKGAVNKGLLQWPAEDLLVIQRIDLSTFWTMALWNPNASDDNDIKITSVMRLCRCWNI